MKKIPLTQDKIAFVDSKDFLALNKYKWYAKKDRKTFYAVRKSPTVDGTRNMIYMHMVIMKTSKGKQTDHIDGNGLNNQRKNLRVCTSAENCRNSGKQVNNKSGYKGVSWFKSNKKWVAEIKVDKKRIYLGSFDDKLLAYAAYCRACIKYHGKFAKL